jgi:FAD/FMN-containing dehydrogenase
MQTWTNWAGNQRFAARRIVAPTSEDEAIDAARMAIAAGHAVGMAGSAHSYTPIVATDHTLIDMTGVTGVLATYPERRTAEVLAGTTLAALGPQLWDAGLSLINLGDVDKQTIGGAIATATHGSGIAFGSLSSTVRGVRLVTGTGEVVDIDESRPDALHAAQVAVGMLGVVTRVTLDVTPAYRLQEANEILPIDDVLAGWDESVAAYRHFSFFWAPTEKSHTLYDLPYIPADHCYVKMLRELEVDPELDAREPITGETANRTGRAYLIYPDTADDAPSWVELEYMVDARHAKDSVLALRRLMQEEFPEAISPIQVRWIKGEPAFLSPMHGRDTVSISVSGELKLDWDGFLRAVDRCLQPWAPRGHWGKQHYLDHARMGAVYPELDRFLAVRQELDPRGLFLNDHLRALLGL